MIFRNFLFLLLVLCIPDASAGGLTDTMVNSFQQASSGWMTNGEAYAKHLFLELAGLEFAWAGIQYTLRKNDLPDFLISVTLKVMGIGFFFSLLSMAPSWIPAVMNSFTQAGGMVSGIGNTPLTPSTIIDQGINVASAMITLMQQNNTSWTFMFADILIGLSGLLTIAAFTFVAMQLLVTLIESYMVIGGGMLMLGFLGSRWTLPFGEKYFGYAVSVGIKMFVLYLLVGAGSSLSNAVIHHLQTLGHAPGLTDYFAATASSMAYGVLGFMAPGMAGSMMNGSPSMSMGNMASAAGGIAGSGISTAAKIGAAGLSTASSAQSIYDKTMGALGGGSGGPGGIGGSMGSGGGGIGGSFGSGVGKIGGAGFEPGNADKHTLPGLGEPGPKSASGPGSSSGIRSTGNSDSIEDPRGGNPKGEGKGENWLDKQSRKLDDMSRRMDRMPHNDGHSGGVSIRFNHTD